MLLESIYWVATNKRFTYIDYADWSYLRRIRTVGVNDYEQEGQANLAMDARREFSSRIVPQNGWHW